MDVNKDLLFKIFPTLTRLYIFMQEKKKEGQPKTVGLDFCEVPEK
jgi:hypothetical protein